MWADQFVMGLASLHKKGDPARERMENTLRSIHKDMIEAAKRGARLQIAYKMIDNSRLVSLDHIAHVSSISIEEVECLADIRRIRKRQERNTLARVVENALQAQLDKLTIAKIVDLDTSEVDELIEEKDNEEYVFDFSFLQKFQSNTTNNQLLGEGS